MFLVSYTDDSADGDDCGRINELGGPLLTYTTTALAQAGANIRIPTVIPSNIGFFINNLISLEPNALAIQVTIGVLAGIWSSIWFLCGYHRINSYRGR